MGLGFNSTDCSSILTWEINKSPESIPLEHGLSQKAGRLALRVVLPDLLHIYNHRPTDSSTPPVPVSVATVAGLPSHGISHGVHRRRWRELDRRWPLEAADLPSLENGLGLTHYRVASGDPLLVR